ncbi:phosphoribosyltransferase family protein [Cellulomonas sp. McL0617]|uniref:phosphoribosyltransferase family protein n=1 Tax=Cellulomonas sp. McL0617 TaxID=3415675 RepID=UPI003CF7295C
MDTTRERLRAGFRWVGDRSGYGRYSDVTGWWADAATLDALGPELAGLFADSGPTVVLGPQSRGTLLGALVARSIGVGLVEVRKDPGRACDSDAWREATTRPDYRDRHLRLGVRRDLLRSGDRVLFVDDWVATGGQVEACHRLVQASGAHWIGAAVIVDALPDPRLRRDLEIRGLVRVRDLS